MTDLRLKCTKFDFGWGSAPDPAGELTASAPQTPLLDLGAASRQGEGLGWGRGVKEGGDWSGGKGRAPKLLLNQGTSETCYATASPDTIILLIIMWTTMQPLGAGCQDPPCPGHCVRP